MFNPFKQIVKPFDAKPTAATGRKQLVTRSRRGSLKFNSLGSFRKYSSSSVSSISTSNQLKEQQPAASCTQSATENYTVLKVRLLSNWGNAAKIGCTDISLLDSNKERINIDAITVHPKEIQNLNLLFRSSNSMSLVAQEQNLADENFWIAPFDPKRPIELSIISTDPRQVDFLRIMNPPNFGPISIKEIQVFDGLTLLWQGDVDKDIGAVIPLVQRQRIELQDYKAYIESPSTVRLSMMHRDQFGLVPQFTGDKISLELLSNYGNANSIALSHVIFYNTDFQIVSHNSFKVTVRKGVPTNRVDSCVFDEPRKMQSMSNQASFDMSGGITPMIDITLRESVAIGGICVYNTCVAELPMNICTCKIKIYLNDMLTWIGKLKIGTGNPADQNHCMAKVPLSDLNRYFK